MKKATVKSITFLLAICILLQMTPVFATEISSESVSEAPATLAADSVPECLPYQVAVDAGHIQRIYAEEDALDSVVFKNSDNTNTLYIFNENIKYVGSDGRTYDKSNALALNTDGSYGNYANDVLVTYPAQIGSGVQLRYGSNTLQIIPQYLFNTGVLSMDESTAEYENAVMYPKVFGSNTALVYTQTFSGFKEDILLIDRQALNTFSFTVNTNGSALSIQDGVLVASRNGAIWGEFGSVIAYDANHVMVSGSISVTEVTANAQYTVTLSVPSDFLTSADTVYPVVIDPTFIVTSNNTSVIQDTTIFTNYSSSPYGNSSSLYIGDYNEWAYDNDEEEYGTARTYFKFSGLLTHNTFQRYFNAGRVTDVHLNFTDIDCQSGPITISARLCTYAWSESTAVYSSSLWNAGTTEYGIRTVAVSPQSSATSMQYQISILPFVECWMNGTASDNGIVLKASNETARAAVIASGESSADNRPYITVTYSAMPTTENSNVDAPRYFQFINTATGEALSYDGNIFSMSTANIADSSQQFRVYYVGSGQYQIEPFNAHGKLITHSTTSLTVQTAGETLYEEWHFISADSGFHIYSAYNNNYLLSYEEEVNRICSRNATDGSTWTLKFIKLDVPLLQQQDTDTCSSACMLMLLHYYGYTHITEAECVAKAKSLCHVDYPEEWNYVWCIDKTLNYFLTKNNSTTSYTYSHLPSITEDQFRELVLTHLANASPLMVNIKTKDATTANVPYDTEGHYVVVTGLYQDSNTGTYMIVVNDPHHEDIHCKELTLPLSELFIHINRGHKCFFHAS